MASVTDEIKSTIAASWRQSLEGGTSTWADDEGKLHWQTKIKYYRATAELLRDAPDALTWDKIVERANGSRSNFYQVTGSRAPHALLRKYQSAQRSYSADIADLYRRPSAVQQLVDETKVWTHWGYRAGWIVQLEQARDVTRKAAAESLVRVLVEWAVYHPETAGALDSSPPMSAVEDMVLIWGDPASAAAAHDVVRKVIQSGLSPLGTTANGVVKSIAEQLNRRLSHHGVPEPDPVARLVGVTFDTVQWLGTLPPDSRTAATRSVVSLFEDTLAELKGLE